LRSVGFEDRAKRRPALFDLADCFVPVEDTLEGRRA